MNENLNEDIQKKGGVKEKTQRKNGGLIRSNKKVKKETIFNIVIILAIIIFCFGICPITLQNDTYYTIKIGEHILQNGIDMKDPFSWHNSLAYTYPHWAYDVLIYIIYSIGGFLGIYLSTVIFASILGVLIYLTQSKISKNKLTSAIITFGVMYLLKDFIAARAQLLTFSLFVLTIFFIEMFLESKRKRYAIGLVIIPTIIANIHLAVYPFYFILYLPYIGEYIIAVLRDSQLVSKIYIKDIEDKITKLNKKLNKLEKSINNNSLEKNDKNEIISLDEKETQIQEIKNKIQLLNEKIEKIKQRAEELKKESEEKRKNSYKLIIDKRDTTKYLILIMLICTLVGFLTPLGTTPYTYLVKTMEGNTTHSISEHLPLTLIENKNTMYVIVGVLALLIFTKSKIKLRDLFMIGGLCYLSFMTRRQVSMFVLIGAYTINKMIAELFDKYDRDGSRKAIEQISTILGRIIFILLIVLISVMQFKPKVNNKFVNEATYPVDAAKFIKENIDLSTMKLWNEYNYGSYLLYCDIPVFIDSRADLYAPEFNREKQEDGTYYERDIFSDYMNVSTLGTYYEDKFEEYEITHVIQYKKSKTNMFLSRDEKYKEIYTDDYFVIYERLGE